jgi:hypothetical protein
MDRLLGTLTLVLLAAAGLFAAAAVVPAGLLWIAVATAALGCIAVFALVYSGTLQSILQGVALRMPARAATPLSRLLLALRAYSTRHGALMIVVAASLVVNVLRVLQAYVLGRSLDLEAPFLTYAAFIPIIVLVMQLPITLYGLGTTQVAFWWFFGHVGMGEAEAVALSMLFLVLGLVGALPGAFLYLFDSPRHAASDRDAL